MTRITGFNTTILTYVLINKPTSRQPIHLIHAVTANTKRYQATNQNKSTLLGDKSKYSNATPINQSINQSIHAGSQSANRQQPANDYMQLPLCPTTSNGLDPTRAIHCEAEGVSGVHYEPIVIVPVDRHEAARPRYLLFASLEPLVFP